MDIFITIFNETLYRPIFNLLVVLYNTIPGGDFGIAIIAVTVLFRIVFYPLSHKALKSQRALQNLQPHIKKLQEKYKGKKEQQARAVMEFYKEHNINPFAGCLPILVQLPVLFALYRVFLVGLTPESLSALYPFVSEPHVLNSMFLGIIDLAEPNKILAVFAGFSQFLQSRATFGKSASATTSTSGGPDISKIMSRQMMYVMPLFMIFIAWNFPAGLALYWVVTMLFSFGQQLVVNRMPQELAPSEK